MNIFPPITLNDTEMDIVADKLSDPAVKKYFHSLANNAGTNLALGTVMPEQTEADFLRRRATLQGHLEVLEGLLSINVAESRS